MASDEQVDAVRSHWNARAARYTETANKRVTLQCAQQLHANLQLESAQSVIEVAAGAGLCSLDALARMSEGPSETKKHFVVTDLSPTMVQMAQENLKAASERAKDRVHVSVVEANGQDLVSIDSGSMDRYISSLCLQLCPDPDALLREARRVLKSDGVAGFTIWGRPEFSGLFTIDAAVCKEIGSGDGSDHPNFAMGKDLNALRERFAAAGFSRVAVWPFLCVLEAWSGEAFGDFYHHSFFSNASDDETRARRKEIATRLATEWISAKRVPIGLETYIILARP